MEVGSGSELDRLFDRDRIVDETIEIVIGVNEDIDTSSGRAQKIGSPESPDMIFSILSEKKKFQKQPHTDVQKL